MYVRCRLLDRRLQAQRSRRLWLKPPRRRRGPCKRKRARDDAAARMAEPPDANRWSLFMWTSDCHEGSFVYGVRFEPIPPGSGAPVEPIPPDSVDEEDPILPWSDEDDRALAAPVAEGSEFRPSMDPVIRYSEKEQRYSAHAAVAGGTILTLVHGSTRTVVHDGATGADTPGPAPPGLQTQAHHAPRGDDDDTVLVMNETVRPGRHCFEALRRVPGGGWRADAIPDPPVAYEEEEEEEDYDSDDSDFDEDIDLPGLDIVAYFARGSRAWISLHKVGTLSLDMDRGAWRMEGRELPLRHRGFFVPELGLVVGIPKYADRRSTDKERCYEVCALDVEAGRPPAVRCVWEIPPERVDQVSPWEMVSLAYLGDGRFCIARSIDVKVPTDHGRFLSNGRGTSFTLLDMRRSPGGDLELAKHGKVHAHTWPWGHVGHARFLQPAAS